MVFTFEANGGTNYTDELKITVTPKWILVDDLTNQRKTITSDVPKTLVVYPYQIPNTGGRVDLNHVFIHGLLSNQTFLVKKGVFERITEVLFEHKETLD